MLSGIHAQNIQPFVVSYGKSQVSSPTRTAYYFTLTGNSNPSGWPLGARIEYPLDGKSGEFCAKIKAAAKSGNAFAMYLTSKEPENRAVERWDEYDFEFVGVRPFGIWTNVFRDGKDTGSTINYDMRSPENAKFNLKNGYASREARYCLRWKVGDKAQWFIDGQLLRTLSLTGRTKRVHPVLSFWGVPRQGADPALVGWAGAQALNAGEKISASATSITVTMQDTAPANIKRHEG